MSDNHIAYNGIFKTVFGVDDYMLDSLVYKEYHGWDSMAHIALISSIEETFNICFEMEDIFAFNSYVNGKLLLKNRFGIDVETI